VARQQPPEKSSEAAFRNEVAEAGKRDSSTEMRAFAYRLLGRREYSVYELIRRIGQKWPGAEGINGLVDALVEENLVSDERFTESFVRFRVQRFQGPLKIKAALRTKGVSDTLISRELNARSEEWTGLAAPKSRPDGLRRPEKILPQAGKQGLHPRPVHGRTEQGKLTRLFDPN
jgi:regulatory protein